MRPRKIVWAVPAGTANGICQSQTPGAGGPLTLNGSLVSAGVASLSSANCSQRRVAIASTANDAARTFTIVGTAAAQGSGDTGPVIQESLGGPNASSVTSVLDYATVTSISVDAATAGAITAGTNASASTPWQQPELELVDPPFAIGLGIFLVSGSATWGVEHQFDRVRPAKDWVMAPDVFPHSSIGPGQTASHDGNYAFPVTAFRLSVTAGTGTLNFHWLQQGVVGGSSP
jgi:hypothetical protein